MDCCNIGDCNVGDKVYPAGTPVYIRKDFIKVKLRDNMDYFGCPQPRIYRGHYALIMGSVIYDDIYYVLDIDFGRYLWKRQSLEIARELRRDELSEMWRQGE